MSLSLKDGVEIVSTSLLSILNRIEKIESNENLTAKQEAFIAYTKEQSMLRAALIISVSDNFNKYDKKFITEEVQKGYKFCKNTEKKLMLLENTIKEK